MRGGIAVAAQIAIADGGSGSHDVLARGRASHRQALNREMGQWYPEVVWACAGYYFQE
jgi:hypothetical protein